MARKQWTWTPTPLKASGASTAPSVPARCTWPRCWQVMPKKGCRPLAFTDAMCGTPGTRKFQPMYRKNCCVLDGRRWRRPVCGEKAIYRSVLSAWALPDPSSIRIFLRNTWGCGWKAWTKLKLSGAWKTVFTMKKNSKRPLPGPNSTARKGLTRIRRSCGAPGPNRTRHGNL